MTDLFKLGLTSWHGFGAALFVVSFALVFYVYIGYPALLAAISSLVPPRRIPTGFQPSISVLICAYNEASGIRAKLESTLKLDYPMDKFEVVVVSDGSTDATEEIVQSFADIRLRLMRTTQRKGKTNAQNEGVRTCKGDIVVFSDATTVYHSQALRYLAANYRDPMVGAVSGQYQYFDEDGNSPTGAGTIAFWNYENTIKRLQSRIKTITGCCGCIYSVRKGAYTELPPDIISDLVQPLHAIRKGYRVVFEKRALAYEATTESSQQEFKMRVRVITRAMRGLLSVRELLNPLKSGWVSFQLLSHKVLRWFVPFYLLGLLVGNALLVYDLSFKIMFGLQLAFYLSALLALVIPLHRISKVLGIPLYFCTINIAAFVSVIELLRGRKYVVWETVRP